ncbi:hypothetical protein [Vibrio furnissii]|uniref:hypothetical protein n=1 Tax=Vibrio furnissii TaxID=29494 RepID=UPI001EEAABA2|nr:hypothetical protein [Vibrio furnissii]
MNIEDLVSALSQIKYKQSLEWYVYVFVILSSGLGAFFIAYFKEKGKNYATKEDFDKLTLELSRKNTELVEGIKSEFSHKTWVNQQFFPTKLEIMRLATNIICEYQELMRLQIQEQMAYHYIEYEYCGFSCGGYVDVPYDAEPKYHKEAERLFNEYWEFATKEIELEREKYKKKYLSAEYKEKENVLLKSILTSIDDVLILININRALLTDDTIRLSVYFNEIKSRLTDSSIIGDVCEYQEMSNDERSEYFIKENKKLLSEVDNQYIQIIKLTKDELNII